MWSVLFVFLSYLDRNWAEGDPLGRALDAERRGEDAFGALDGALCAGGNLLYPVPDGAEAARSAVGASGEPVACAVAGNRTQVRPLGCECGPVARPERTDEARQMRREVEEGSGLGEDPAPRHRGSRRSKRGFTYPGTLWCGAGNMADHYDQLGDFAETDSCCRTHDHCPHVIHAFSSNYGHTNFKWHSICHCDCDTALKDCLRKVNDTSSRVVGQAFFNVIGVPCFELAYEEQCAERHWYGLCKRYEKFPVAVLKEAVPYDFGGIDVIDELTVAPPRKKDISSSGEGEEKPETTAQPAMAGPGEPSLTNVVTAAEDFIKVLATVSTSQSSTAESGESEAQSSEKKKRKNAGKKEKATKKQKGNGKGGKRKQKAGVGVKTEEGAAVPTTGGRPGEAISLSNFIGESQKHNEPRGNGNRVGDDEYELGGKGEPSNEVMRDEPAAEKEAVSAASSEKVLKKPAESDRGPASTATFIPPEAETRGLRKGRRKKSKKAPLPSSKELVTDTMGDPRGVSEAPLARRQGLGHDPEKRPATSTARTPTVIPKVKRNRSKETGAGEGRKRRRKVSSAPPAGGPAHEGSPVDDARAIPLGWMSAGKPAPAAAERQVSHRPDVYGGKASVQVTARNSSFSVSKRQRSKERGLRGRKTAPPPSSGNLPHRSVSGSLPPLLPAPDTSRAPDGPATPAAENLATRRVWRVFRTAAPSASTKPHRQTRKKAATAALGFGAPLPGRAEHRLTTITAAPSEPDAAGEPGPQRSGKPGTATSSTHIMSPMQLSIERVRAQFMRKKRRKAAMARRQQ